jgi:hypothetical protein
MSLESLPPSVGESAIQRTLAANQVAAFYHDVFVDQQVADFRRLSSGRLGTDRVVVDIGGGCGFFAAQLSGGLNGSVRVIDIDPLSVAEAKKRGVDAVLGNALTPPKQGDEGIACFNLVLHHLVSDTERRTRALQTQALSAWRGDGVRVFVNEYIYESWVGDFSGWIIYQITKNRLLSALGQAIARVVPTLHANTFGVGVRFRSNADWKRLFSEAGFATIGEVRGEEERISLPRRLLFIKSIRRDSFLIAP